MLGAPKRSAGVKERHLMVHGRLREWVVRGADIAIALVGLPLAVPVMLILALLVLLSMGRPVLFVQDRAGLGGRTFRLRKFRSMTFATGPTGELLPDSQRVTGLGRFLRRTRFDELPQLWNILIGQMSLIGPRPLLPVTIAARGEEGRIRCSVRPGLTGWAQISGNSSLNNDDKIALDLWYIPNRSLRLDAMILWQTAMLMLFGEHISDARLHAAQSARARISR
jgi:lipopolysaccharide/colanic/teichoic acid biosynthesis glycosyltransferase